MKGCTVVQVKWRRLPSADTLPSSPPLPQPSPYWEKPINCYKGLFTNSTIEHDHRQRYQLQSNRLMQFFVNMYSTVIALCSFKIVTLCNILRCNGVKFLQKYHLDQHN
jgi:hypothetical protein